MTNDDDPDELDLEQKREILREMRGDTILLWLMVILVASVLAFVFFNRPMIVPY
jgi:hypothetical protein